MIAAPQIDSPTKRAGETRLQCETRKAKYFQKLMLRVHLCIVDGSDDPPHKSKLRHLARDHSNWMRLYFQRVNGGVARAKHSCIRLLLQSGEPTLIEIM